MARKGCTSASILQDLPAMASSSFRSLQRSRPRQIRIVVTCSDRKSVAVPTELRIRTLPLGSVADRCRTWIERLERSTAPSKGAEMLYAGDHWAVVRSLPAAGPWVVDLWVASAGYGLVPVAAKLKSYAATFARAHPDFVGIRGDGASPGEWWRELGRWSGPVSGGPRSLAVLAAQEPARPLMVVASASYIRALASDILDARSRLADPEQIVVVCVGSPSDSRLDDVLVTADPRIQSVLGGAMQSVNVRLARHLLETADGVWNVHHFRGIAADLIAGIPPAARPRRTPMTDAQVRAYIERELGYAPRPSRTQLLTRFRKDGLACEQARFGCLYADVTREIR